MARLFGVLVLIAAAWGAWTFGLQPIVQPQATTSLRPRPTPAPVHRATAPAQHPGTATARGGAATARGQAFLEAWSAGRYDAMYDAVSLASQQAISRTAFVDRYKGIAAEATITRIRPAVLATRVDGGRAVVTYTVAMSTTAVGPISYINHMDLGVEKGRWAIAWSPNLIFPGLGPYRVHLYTESSRRGAIVDRLGQPLAVQGNMVEVGVVPAYIRDEKKLLAFLSGWLHMPAKTIKDMYHVAWAVQHPTDFVPITTISSVQWKAVQREFLDQMNNGLDMNQGVSRRLYPRGNLASPLLGYVTSTDGHGVAGLEGWADTYLSGHDGAKLSIANAPDYSYQIAKIAERPVQNGSTVHLTLDTALQEAATRALGGKAGSVVAIRPSDGAVLAMVSTPGFDPNAFVTGLSGAQYKALVTDPHQPLFNRAALGAYPLGSIFKIVAMGAALEKGGYTAATTISGPGVWYGLGASYPMRDWLASGHGIISLHEALVQSCDTCFYQVGQKLDTINHYLLPDYARAWGFGAPTGIVGVRENSGIIPDPHWTLTSQGQPWVPGDAVNMTIGQGYVEVTPLQVAQMLAALGDNGVMHRPYVVRQITAADGTVIRDYPPVVKGTLPLSPAHRQDILGAMLGVTTEPAGTAADKFAGFRWPVAGKTGTAQAGTQGPHAWFAALAPADHPRIALVVMVEHGGEGSAVAAPMARQILRTFFTRDQDLAGTAPGKGPGVINVP